MSQQAQGAFVTAFSSVVISNYCGISATALLLCEYFGTFPDERNMFWRRKWTGASVLFFMNRYIPLASYVLNNMNFGVVNEMVGQTRQADRRYSILNDSVVSCHTYIKACTVVEMLQYVPWAGFSALRAYALWSNRAMSCLIFALSMVPVGANAAYFWSQSSIVIERLGCLGTDTVSANGAIRYVAMSRSSLILSDILVISVTWAALYRHNSVLLERHSLMYILLRDGTVYFTVLTTQAWSQVSPSVEHAASYSQHHLEPYVAIMLSYNRSATSTRYQLQLLTNYRLTAILMSRFMLNLQAVDHRNRNHNSTLGELDSQHLPAAGNGSLVFQRVIGSLGSTGIDESIPVSPGAATTLEPERYGLSM
ncbi:hypothetical protein C8Q76DRAFT_689283 [Earliella scabrosa]|nr:hypothetical protein C8Q76DRAFT_689283 [Earliella scabrosa]